MKKEKPRSIRIADADPAAFFPSGLEYNTPVRGMWNIVHTGMLVPGAHQIFACAQGCLRGVILTAAEMNALERLSWISVSEQDMYDGTLEQDIIDGCAEILHKLPEMPRVILLYLSCIHLFAGVDFPMILRTLSEMFPAVQFVDCYMTPTMRQTVTPVVKMAAQLYAALQPRPLNPKSVSILGNDRPTDENSELVRLIRENGFILRDITLCKTYGEYQEMAESAWNITYTPVAGLAGAEVSERFGGKHLELPVRYDFDGIGENYHLLCAALGIPKPHFTEEKVQAVRALQAARAVIGDMSIGIDFTAVTRPFELAKLLAMHGFNVRYVIADTAAGEQEAFTWLRENRPKLEIFSAVNVNMLEFHAEEHEPVLAIGQKAAYYFATDHFVNMVMGGGYYGYAGIATIAGLIKDAYQNPKNRREVVRHKGLGCASCLL